MPLEPDDIDSKLKGLSLDWTVVTGNTLVRVFKFDDFKSAVGFVVLVGELADKADHHPDIKLSWGKVEVSLTTHSESGLTQKDFDLARQVEELDTK